MGMGCGKGFVALVDSIYEAAFCPENWNEVLAKVERKAAPLLACS